MSGNSFGKILKLTSWGESHGEAIGGVLDGVPSNIELTEDDINYYMQKRRPKGNKPLFHRTYIKSVARDFLILTNSKELSAKFQFLLQNSSFFNLFDLRQRISIRLLIKNLNKTRLFCIICLLQKSSVKKRFSPGTTSRNESDRVKILSGVFEGKTTGTPISFIIENEDAKSKDYSKIKDLFRPGHADYTYFMKYGNRDYRGGGRASARETAVRVAAGAIARKIIFHINITGALIQIGDIAIDENNWNNSEIDNNGFFSPDSNVVPKWEKLLEKVKAEGDSIGAMVKIVASNVDVGLGEPVYNRLDAELAGAIMGINAVKSVEIGAGCEVVKMRGSENCDSMEAKNKKVFFNSNNAGGILGGISTGQDIVIKFALKPTSSISMEQNTITKDFENTKVSTEGRHDVCVGIRSVPVGEAMVALVLADYYLLNKIYK